MVDSFKNEELALRRRLLFRLLREFSFDRPVFQGEPISDPVPKALITSEYRQFGDRSAALFLGSWRLM